MIKLIHGDCLDKLKELEDNSVDSIVCDPPYGLSFMGKKWDYDVPSEDIWRECLRVLKPGGHLLAFAGTRTQHRMAVRIEDAGFEIRDMIAWVYGSGFPKSLDISKAIDKGARGQRVVALIQALIEQGHTLAELGEKAGIPSLESSYRDWSTGGHRPEERSWERLLQGLGFSEADGLKIISRRTVTIGGGSTYTFREGEARDYELKQTAPATEAAKQWEGWGTALKPALEPITVARKPLIGTVAENVLTHGTGGINIDGCRVGLSDGDDTKRATGGHKTSYIGGHIEKNYGIENQVNRDLGRFPANLLHDGSEEVVGLFPYTHGHGSKRHTGSDKGMFNWGTADRTQTGGESGSAARFFYCAKASKKDRGEDNKHPTVKPTDLMRYLCRLVTPQGGIVLDPFMGSGSTGKAAIKEGFNFIGIELDPEYMEIAKARINACIK